MTDATLTYWLTTALGVIGVLIIGIYNIMQSHAKHNTLALEKKASLESLAKAEADFKSALERQYTQFQERVQELSNKQDREIDWLKDELQRFNEALADMRRENNQGQSQIMAQLSNLQLALRT